jgi:hypothetical protein
MQLYSVSCHSLACHRDTMALRLSPINTPSLSTIPAVAALPAPTSLPALRRRLCTGGS